MNNRKRAVSIRMSAADIGSVKKIAKRLGVRDSDVIRCAVKMMMSKLGPLADSAVRGRNLVPVFVESGIDLFRHFELDAMRLEVIINDGVSEESQVEHDDIQLLAMNGVQRSYIKLRLSAIGGSHQTPGQRASGANGTGHDDEDERDGAQRLDDSLRQYLYEKYVFRANAGTNSSIQSNRLEMTNE
jgi:predicted DNA binding CopG/RHH family protein